VGHIFRSKLCENLTEIVDKKYTVAHTIPDVTPRKNKIVLPRSGYFYAGSSGTKINVIKLKPDFEN
jgi:hypothetical protein